MAGYIGSKASVVSSGAEHKKLFNITTTTTSLTGLVYTPTLVHVFHNGVRLVDGTDYTATTGTSITLTVAAENGDQVAVISYATFQTSDTVSASAGGTFGNSVTMSSGAVVNRTGDGTIIDLQSGGTTVGSIGVASGQLTIGDGDLGLIFNEGGSDRISPWNISSGASSDAAIDLGETYGRFKDLYLSGGVYLGGAVAANKLDDYEEGTSSGTLFPNSGGSFTTATYTGRYRKISSLVHFSFEATITTLGSGNTGFLVVLPFTADGSFGYSGTGRRMTDNVQFHTVVDGTTYLLARNTAAGGTLEAGSTTYKGMIIYHST
jgi:hypothetical protein